MNQEIVHIDCGEVLKKKYINIFPINSTNRVLKTRTVQFIGVFEFPRCGVMGFSVIPPKMHPIEKLLLWVCIPQAVDHYKEVSAMISLGLC